MDIVPIFEKRPEISEAAHSSSVLSWYARSISAFSANDISISIFGSFQSLLNFL
jgi:hypothetical protein